MCLQKCVRASTSMSRCRYFCFGVRRGPLLLFDTRRRENGVVQVGGEDRGGGFRGCARVSGGCRCACSIVPPRRVHGYES